MTQFRYSCRVWLNGVCVGLVLGALAVAATIHYAGAIIPHYAQQVPVYYGVESDDTAMLRQVQAKMVDMRLIPACDAALGEAGMCN